MLKDYFTAAEIAVILDINLASAQEIVAGTLQLEADELIELAESKDLTVEQLIK